MAEADRLFSLKIRARDNRCLECGEITALECAHILSRSYKAIRWDPDNAVTLCLWCARRFTEHPRSWGAWVEARWPGRIDELRERARVGMYVRPDFRAILERLKA